MNALLYYSMTETKQTSTDIFASQANNKYEDESDFSDTLTVL